MPDQTGIPIPKPPAFEHTAIPRATKTRWLVLLLISVMYMITYMDRTGISIAAPSIAREFGFSQTAIGIVFSVFLWAYAIAQIPAGWFADRFGPRLVLLIIVPFWSLMTALTAVASGIVSLAVIRFIFGLAEAGAFPTATRAMQLWFPKAERGIVHGVTHSFSRFAVAIVPFIAVSIMVAFGWRWIFYVFGAAGVLWSFAFYLLYRNLPEEHPKVNRFELADIRGWHPDGTIKPATFDLHRRPAVPWKTIFRSTNMWYIAAGYCAFYYGTYFFITWFPAYLIEYRHLSLKAAGMVASPAMLASAVCLVPAATTLHAWTAILCLTGSLFFLELVVGPAWAVPMDVGGEYSGTVSGVMNMAGSLAASLSPIIFGFLIQKGFWIAPFFIAAGVLLTGALV